MTSQPDAPICGDPMRALFYERVGRYFEKAEEAGAKTADGVCGICGAELRDAPTGSDGAAACRAQRSLTQKRSRPAAGQPLAFGVPNDPESRMNAMNEIGNLVMIAPGRTFVATNVIPTAPLPPEMEAVRVVRGVETAFFRAFLAAPPEPPFLLVRWERKATVPLEATLSLRHVALCGGDPPQHFDVERVRELAETAGRLGAARFAQACGLRAEIGRLTDPWKIAKANQALREFVVDGGLALRDFNRLPARGDLVFDLAMKIVGAEAEPDPEAGAPGAASAA